MWWIGPFAILLGYLCFRLGRWWSGYAWDMGGQAVAISILIRIVGVGLAIAGIVRLVRDL